MLHLLKFSRLIKKTDGYGFMETMVAMSILLMGSIGTLGLLTHSIRSSTTSKQISIATNQARFKMEEIKNNLPTVLPYNEETVVDILPDGKCNISITDSVESGLAEISVVVSWKEGNFPRKEVQLATLVKK